MSWADTKNAPKNRKNAKKADRGNRWDVDQRKADALYDRFTAFDRPRSSWAYLDYMPSESEHVDVEIGSDEWNALDWYERANATREKNRLATEKRIQPMVERLNAARVMVQTFVDALSGEQSDYTVSLDNRATTAMTDLKNRVMKLPARTILDPEITDQEAALLCVAFLGHEIGHVRIDDHLDKELAQDRDVIERGLYNSLSTVLREAHVEAGFSAMFPGYSGLFEPMLRWISRGTKDGSKPPANAIDFAIAATRYPFRFDWSDPNHAAERDWWTGWVAKYATAEDYPTHKTALDLAYAHIKAALKGQQDDEGDEQDGQDGEPEGEPGEGGQGGATMGQPGEGMESGRSDDGLDLDMDIDGLDDGSDSESGSSRSKSSGKGSSQSKTPPYESLANEKANKSDFALNREKNEIEQAARDAKAEVWEKYNNKEITAEDRYDQEREIERKAKADKAAATRDRNKAAAASSSIPASIEEIEAPELPGKNKRERAEAAHDLDIATRQTNEEAGFNGDGGVIQPAKFTTVGTEWRRDADGAYQTIEVPLPRDPGTAEGDNEAVGIFRSLFMRMRGGNQGRVGSKRSGRLDDHRIYRLADRRDDRVFTRRGAAKTQPLRVYLLVDISGSMGGLPIVQVRNVAKALIEASIGADNLTLEVYGWHTEVNPCWTRGNDPNDVMLLVSQGGTDDVGALKWAQDKMDHEKRTEEHGLIIMMSDGAGAGAKQLKVQVENTRKSGHSVYAISMDERLDQTESYGEGQFVKWQGSVAATAAPLAEIIQQSWLARDQHRAGGRES